MNLRMRKQETPHVVGLVHADPNNIEIPHHIAHSGHVVIVLT